MKLDELGKLADAAEQPIENSMLDFQDAANPQTIKQLIALIEMQHEALNAVEPWVAIGELSDEYKKLEEALAAFDKFH